MADKKGRGYGGDVHDADVQESQVAIGAGERTIGVGEISLTENLNDTRHIDILIKQSNGPRPQATGVGAAPEDTAALNGRLKITVVVEKDTDILKEMRGWLMTVGTLFVTMAFQAALQPPAWMRTEDFLRINQSDINRLKHLFRGASHAAATAPAMQFAPSPGPSSQAAESTRSLYWRAGLYMLFNAVTFATALWLVLVLLLDITPARAERTTKGATYMMVGMGISVMATFALGSSDQWLYTLLVGIAIVVYAFFVVLNFKLFPEGILLWHRRRAEKRRRAEALAESPAPSHDHSP